MDVKEHNILLDLHLNEIVNTSILNVNSTLTNHNVNIVFTLNNPNDAYLPTYTAISYYINHFTNSF